MYLKNIAYFGLEKYNLTISIMFSAALFDMDGVIIDSEPARQRLEQQLFHYIGAPVTEQEHQSYVGMTSKGMMLSIKEKYHLSYSVEQMIEMEQDQYIKYLQNNDDQLPIPGVIDLIKDLHDRGIKLVVASSASLKNIEIVVNKFKLSEFFEAKVSGEEVQYSKPAPDVFLEAAKRINTHPKKCIVFEDAKNGIQAAKLAGMKCVGVASPHRIPQDLSGADMVIEHFSEIDYDKLREL